MAKSYKRIINLEWIARLENMRWRDPEIAHHLGLTLAGLAQCKQDPDFPKVRARILTGVLSDADMKMSEENEYLRERIRGMLPAALDGLYELAVQTKNDRVRLAACESITDREGHLAKVTRIGLPTEDQGGLGAVDDEAADALIIALQASRKVKEASLENTKPSTNTVH